MSYCVYKGCENQNKALGSKKFFAIPKDERRDVWIQNSGNPDLPEMLRANSRKLICEDHFDPKLLHKQFNRTLLNRNAVPYPYQEEMYEEEDDAGATVTKINMEVIEMQQIDALQSHNSVHEFDCKNSDLDLELIAELESDQCDSTVLFGNSDDIQFIGDEIDDDENENDEYVNVCISEISPASVEPCKVIVPEEVPSPVRTFIPTEPAAPASNSNQQTKSHGYTEDEHFVLSLVGPLQRLPGNIKPFVKLKIMQLLMDAEIKGTV